MIMNRSYIIILLCSLWSALPLVGAQAENRDFIVVIDPGHGGRDPGAIGKRGKEKNINLNVALKLGKLIRNWNLINNFWKKQLCCMISVSF